MSVGWLRRGQALFPMFDLALLLNPQLQGEMAMPCPPRIQFPDAIYNVITRGDGRRTLFHAQGPPRVAPWRLGFVVDGHPQRYQNWVRFLV